MDFQKLDAYMQSLETVFGVPSCEIAVTLGEETVFSKTYGYSDAMRKQPAAKTDLYRLFSMTKLITVIAVLQQMEQNRLCLDSLVEEFLPDFKEMKVADSFDRYQVPVQWPTMDAPCHPARTPIRVVDLLTMTAGMTYDLSSPPVAYMRNKRWEDGSTQEVVAQLAKQPLVYEPGERWVYSLAHDVLGAIVEIVSGQKLGDYMNAHIFEPLGIEPLYFHLDSTLQSRVAALYQQPRMTHDIIPDDGKVSDSFKVTRNYESGGAGLIGTVSSYSAIVQALACGGIGRNRILQEETVALLSKPYTKGMQQKDFSGTGKKGYAYGYGVRVLTDASTSRSPVGEFGWDGAAGAFNLVDPFNKVSITNAQHIMGFMDAYIVIHPTIRDLTYEALGL